MNKKYYVAGIIVLLILVCSLVVRNQDTSDLKIGIMVPLTGKSASFGERVRNGVILAIDDIEKDGGSVTPLFEDDKGEAATAVTVANKLITVDNIDIIIGTVKSDAMLAVAPVTEKNKVILFSPTAGAAGISEAGDYVFRNIETPALHGEADSVFFHEKDIENVAVFIANASNAQGYGLSFINSFGKIGLIVATTTYNQDDSDFRTLISKSLVKKPEGIYLAVSTGKDAGILTRQIRELGFNGLIMASVAADSKEFFDAAGSSSEGTYVSTSFFDPSKEPGKTYNEKFKEKYKVDSDAFAANAYDATMLLYKASRACSQKERTDCIRDYLYSTKNYPGVSGLTTFDSKGDVTKPVAFKIAQSGVFILASSPQ